MANKFTKTSNSLMKLIRNSKTHWVISVSLSLIMALLFYFSFRSPAVRRFAIPFFSVCVFLLTSSEILFSIWGTKEKKTAGDYSFLHAVIALVVPLIIAGVFLTIMLNVLPEKMPVDEPASGNPVDPNPVSSSLESSEPEKDEPSLPLKMNFRDIYFDAFSSYEMQKKKSDISDYICNHLKDPIEDNYDENFYKYEELLAPVHDYEAMYIDMVSEELFTKYNQHERIDCLDDAISCRVDADKYHKSSDNQSLISARYCERAAEDYGAGNPEAAIKDYREAIYWQLTGIQTFLSYPDDSHEISLEERFDKVSFCYENLEFISNSSNQEKATIMIEIYASVKNSIVQ